jgi:hypothetical protein
MPITFVVDQLQRRVHTTVTGDVTSAELMEHFQAVQRAGVLSYPEVVELGNTELPSISVQEIWAAAKMVRGLPSAHGVGPRAVVVANDLQFGLSRVFTSVVEGALPIEIFRERQAAERWLDTGMTKG